ncbi:MAG: glycogen synthase GlgA [Endomicrobiia bacterium]
MNVLICSFECVPFAKVGGLADVVGTLPKFLKSKKIDVRVVIPLHKKIDRKKFGLKNLNQRFLIPVGGIIDEGNIWQGKIDSVPVYFIENSKYFDRDEIYRTKDGDYSDNPLRFIFFSRSVLEFCKAIDFKPDIIHCNDMQTGLIPAYLKTLYRIDAFFNKTKTVFTIHNIAYQGVYSKNVFYLAGFSEEEFTFEKLEYYNQINFIKAGIVYSDIVSTVSPTYAIEIQTNHEHGRGLEGVLRTRKNSLFGILNGIDYEEWNPETDKIIKANYNYNDISGKSLCKKDLQNLCGLPKDDVALMGMVSRLDPLKGFDLLTEISSEIVKMPVQLIILGVGDKIYQDILLDISRKYPEKVSLNLKFDNELAHKIYAGCDMFLMPSRSEPCGLGQMIAMRYGTVPVVHKTGGLADSVIQFNPKTKRGTGFLFEEYSSKAFLNAIKKAVESYKEKSLWESIVLNDMKQDFSWNNSVKEYLKIYKLAIKNNG